jgi:RNA polymerase II subunit A C-terminal domain phosphatase SSU72
MMDRRIAVVCASNQNRSMETHALLVKKGFKHVSSFGTNSQVKLPGTAPDKPVVFDFSVPYTQMYDHLRQIDEELFREKGLLSMLMRNSKVKERPQRFQDEKTQQFEIVITFEERVFDIVVEDLSTRESVTSDAVHVINITVKDNHEEAIIGSMQVYDFLMMIHEAGEEWQDRIDEIIEEYQAKLKKPVLHSVHFY